MSKINRDDIVVGQPLAFDCYDKQGSLLLQRGQMIHSLKQVEALVERGLFSQGGNKNNSGEQDKGTKSVPFEIFEQCKARVRALFSRVKVDQGVKLPERVVFEELKFSYRLIIASLDGGKPDNFQEKIIHVCQGIQELCKLDADAALGSIHLDPICRYTTIHPLHKAVLSELLAKRMNISPQERLSMMAAALTANISMLNLQELLHAQRMPLTETQKEMIRLHPLLSVEILSELGVKDEQWIRTVLAHHERLNGSGYPTGMKGEEITLGARIIALADIYGAVIKPRAYREALHAKDALKDIFVAHCDKEDNELIHLFIKEIGIYPPGCFVKLQNGETAIVTRRGISPATPKVKSILDALGMPLVHSISRDTSIKQLAISGALPRNKLVAINFRSLWDYKLAA